MKGFKTVLAIAIIFSGLTSCGGGGSDNVAPNVPAPNTPTPPAPITNDNPIPRLGPGPHMGFIEGFDDLTQSQNPNRQAIAEALRADAVAAGMTLGRAQIDWADLETSQGVFNQQALDDALDQAARNNVAIILVLSTLDSEGLTFPSYLTDSDGNLPNGISIASDSVIDAFENFLDWLIPTLTARDVVILSIGNEVEIPVEDGIVAEADAISFFSAGYQKIKTLDADLAVGVTLTQRGATIAPDLAAAFSETMDIYAVNFYCQGIDNQQVSENQWRAELNELKTTAGEKPIFIQELGCSAGYGDESATMPSNRVSGFGATPAQQAEFFSFMIEQFIDDDQLRAATVFQLYDWSPASAKLFGDLIRDGSPALDKAADDFEESLATIGLCRWQDATCRPSWEVFLEGLGDLSAALIRIVCQLLAQRRKSKLACTAPVVTLSID